MIQRKRSAFATILLVGAASIALTLPAMAQAGAPGSEGGGAPAGAGAPEGAAPAQPGTGADPNQPSGIVGPPQINFPSKGDGAEAAPPQGDSPTAGKPVPPGWQLPGPPPVGGAGPAAGAAPAPSSGGAAGGGDPTAGKPVPPGWQLPGPPPVGGTAATPGAAAPAEREAAAPAAKTPAHGPSSTWPCIQRRMPELSVGALWAGPEIDLSNTDWRDDPALTALVEKLAQRRTTEDEAKAAITAYADGLKENREQKLAQLFGALFQVVNTERKEIVLGIERFAEKQKGLADKIRQDSRQLTAVETKLDKTPEDQKSVQTLRDQFEWDTRIYDSREQSLTAVCESPVLIEQRLYSLARTIQEKLG